MKYLSIDPQSYKAYFNLDIPTTTKLRLFIGTVRRADYFNNTLWVKFDDIDNPDEPITGMFKDIPSHYNCNIFLEGQGSDVWPYQPGDRVRVICKDPNNITSENMLAIGINGQPKTCIRNDSYLFICPPTTVASLYDPWKTPYTTEQGYYNWIAPFYDGLDVIDPVEIGAQNNWRDGRKLLPGFVYDLENKVWLDFIDPETEEVKTTTVRVGDEEQEVPGIYISTWEKYLGVYFFQDTVLDDPVWDYTPISNLDATERAYMKVSGQAYYGFYGRMFKTGSRLYKTHFIEGAFYDLTDVTWAAQEEGAQTHLTATGSYPSVPYGWFCDAIGHRPTYDGTVWGGAYAERRWDHKNYIWNGYGWVLRVDGDYDEWDVDTTLYDVTPSSWSCSMNITNNPDSPPMYNQKGDFEFSGGPLGAIRVPTYRKGYTHVTGNLQGNYDFLPVESFGEYAATRDSYSYNHNWLYWGYYYDHYTRTNTPARFSDALVGIPQLPSIIYDAEVPGGYSGPSKFRIEAVLYIMGMTGVLIVDSAYSVGDVDDTVCYSSKMFVCPRGIPEPTVPEGEDSLDFDDYDHTFDPDPDTGTWHDLELISTMNLKFGLDLTAMPNYDYYFTNGVLPVICALSRINPYKVGFKPRWEY